MDKFTAFKALVIEAYHMAKYAHDYSFDDPEEGIKENPQTVLSYATACSAKSSAAEALYWCSPELENEDVPALLAQFNTFINEVLSDYRDDHSRQWVDIEFERLKELYENFEYTTNSVPSPNRR